MTHGHWVAELLELLHIRSRCTEKSPLFKAVLDAARDVADFAG